MKDLSPPNCKKNILKFCKFHVTIHGSKRIVNHGKKVRLYYAKVSKEANWRIEVFGFKNKKKNRSFLSNENM